MTLGLLYWILMLFWFIFGIWWSYPAYPSMGGHLLLFILLLILGWKAFGPPIHG